MTAAGTKPERTPTLAPPRVYRDEREYTLIIFDLRIAGAEERLLNECSAWGWSATTEMVDEDHFVLIVRPGAARETAV